MWLAGNYALSMQSRVFFQIASQTNVWTGCAHSLSLKVRLNLRRAHTNCCRSLNLSSRLQTCLWPWLEETRLLSGAITNFIFAAFWCNCLFPVSGKPLGMFSWLFLFLFFFLYFSVVFPVTHPSASVCSGALCLFSLFMPLILKWWK